MRLLALQSHLKHKMPFHYDLILNFYFNWLQKCCSALKIHKTNKNSKLWRKFHGSLGHMWNEYIVIIEDTTCSDSVSLIEHCFAKCARWCADSENKKTVRHTAMFFSLESSERNRNASKEKKHGKQRHNNNKLTNKKMR